MKKHQTCQNEYSHLLFKLMQSLWLILTGLVSNFFIFCAQALSRSFFVAQTITVTSRIYIGIGFAVTKILRQNTSAKMTCFFSKVNQIYMKKFAYFTLYLYLEHFNTDNHMFVYARSKTGMIFGKVSKVFTECSKRQQDHSNTSCIYG